MTSLFATDISIAGRLLPVTLSVAAGQTIALVGPNGGGKTSLLRAIARIDRAGGEVRIDHEDLDSASMARRRRLLSFLPASRDVSWPIAVRDVIALGLDQRDEARVEELVSLFELEPFADRPVDRLSTGERARVLMARALASRPRVLLLDEPLSNLDPYWVLRFLEIISEAAAAGQLVLVALHDLAMLPRFDRALLLAQGMVQMNETPARMIASERFADLFRICPAPDGRWAIRPLEDRRSSP